MYKQAACSKYKFCVRSTQSYNSNQTALVFFFKEKLGFYLISHGYRNPQLYFIPTLFSPIKKYLSRLPFRFTKKYPFRSITFMLDDYTVYDGTIIIFCFVYSVHVI